MTSYSNEDIVEIVNIEGLDYAIMHYLNIEDIEDETVKEAFMEARAALCHIQELLPDLDN